jgi:hypothetical protein
VKREPDPDRRRIGPLYRKLWGIPNAVDLLWYTPQELRSGLRFGSTWRRRPSATALWSMKKPADLAAQLLAKAALAVMELGLPHYPVLEEFTSTVVDYTEFAVRLRYDDLPWVTRDEAEKAFQEVRRMQEALLPLLLRPADI